MPRAVLGFPMYCAEAFVADTLDSLIAMDYEDFAIVGVDDCSPDATFEIAGAYAKRDSRILVERNSERLGMIANWNRAFTRARELFDEFEFFSWASDNDLRDPSWLSVLIRALDENPDVILAYSMFGTFEGGRKIPDPKWQFDSRHIADPLERFRTTIKGVPAGPMMYCLHRREILEKVGPIPRVVASDFVFLSHLSLYGRFLQEPGAVWYRGARRTGASMQRHRAALFAGRVPLWTFFPVELQHTLWLIRRMVFGNRRPAGMGRRRAAIVTLIFAKVRGARGIRSRLAHMKKKRRRRNRAIGKWLWSESAFGAWQTRRRAEARERKRAAQREQKIRVRAEALRRKEKSRERKREARREQKTQARAEASELRREAREERE
jgi:glycosyltransferase involved in cell wall biosynthesis